MSPLSERVTGLLAIAKGLIASQGLTPCEVALEVRNGIAHAYSVEQHGCGTDRSAMAFAEVRPDGTRYLNNRSVQMARAVQ